MASEALASLSFVGREEELGRLDAFLDRALAGECAVCFVTGEAGAGKTALLTAFAERAQRRDPDLVVAIGDCNAQTGTGDPYLPFREILGHLTGDVEGSLAQGKMTEENASRLRRLLRSSVQALVENGPDLVEIVIPAGAILTRLGARLASRLPWAARLRELGQRAADDRAMAALTSGLEQSHIYEQFTNVLQALADRRPLVLVLDDLHWIDAASAGLLFHLGRRLGPHRVLIVGGYRPADLRARRDADEGRHSLEPVLTELKRLYGDVWIPLGSDAGAVAEEGANATGSREARRFLDALLDREPNRLGAEFREALFRHTEGHPLFTLELLKSLRERGDLRRDAERRWVERPGISWDALPPRVEAVIDERAGRLEETLRETLRAAAVEGEEFTAEVVASVLREPVREVVGRLSGPLSERHELVWASGVERVDGRRLGRYRFRHNLFQRFFYAELDDVRRAYLHEDVALALEELYAEDLDAAAVRLARHFERASDERKAVEYLRRAGDRARRAHANEDALGHYRRAIGLLEAMPGTHGGDPWVAEMRRRLLEAAADVLELGGRHEEAGDTYARALQLTGATERVDRLDRARLYRKSAKPVELLRQYEDALKALERAAAELGEAPPAGEKGEAWWQERIQVWLDRIWVHYWRDDLQGMERLAGEVRSVLVRASPAQRARLFNCELLVGFRRERYRLSEKTEALARRTLSAAREVGDAREVANGHFVLGFTLLWRGRLEESETHLAEAIGAGRRCGDAVILARALTYLALLHRRMGHVRRAAEVAREALDASAAADMTEYVGMAKANLGWAAWRRGARQEAEALTREATRIWEGLGYTYPVKWGGYFTLFAWAMEDGRIEDAARLAAEMLEPPQVRFPEALEEKLEEGVAAAEANDGEEADRRLREALALGRRAGWV